MALFDIVKRIVSPPCCFGCYQDMPGWYELCQTCLASIQPVAPLDIEVTAKYMLRVYAVGAYEGICARAIHTKFSMQTWTWTLLGRLLAQHSVVQIKHYDLIVPISMHWTRYAWRGFNQAELLSKELSAQTAMPYASVLQKKFRWYRQAQLKRNDRLKKSARDFVLLYPELVKNKRILLVDDVCTTGATLRAAARSLVQARPLSVDALVVARGI